MYTQCPDCSTAFRVTADILRQAAGKVRCGGCGNAFNALDFLSETMPERPPPKGLDQHLPELTPEPLPGSHGLPASISSEQSAALLKTLDELAGSDIRIEDTGVEWRVLDEDELGDAAADTIVEDVDVEDQPHIDEILEDSPTPVDQFLTHTPPQVDAPEIFAQAEEAPSETPVDELRFDDHTPLPDDFGLDDDRPYSAPEREPAPEPVMEATPQTEIDLSDPDEWTDILDEFEGIAEQLAEPGPELDNKPEPNGLGEDQAATRDAKEPGDSSDELLDMDSQFALQAEAMGIDLSGVHEAVDESEETLATTDDFEALLEESGEEVRDLQGLLEEELVEENEDDDTVIVGEHADVDDETVTAGEQADVDDETVTAGEQADDDEAAQLELIDDEPPDEDDSPASDEHYVPPLTEEEQTINMQIDADLLAIAVEDEDGFTSTMVIPEDAADGKADEEKAADEDTENEEEQAFNDTGAGFETIIMEGEAFRSGHDEDKQNEHKAAAAASLASVAEAERAAEDAARAAKRRGYGVAAGITALALLLVGQYVHQARDSLATIPAFNSVVGPVYRAIGKPLSPDWDITGWRFEVTDGKTDAENAGLAIVSRLGNRSEAPLPYPIIAVSLSDRFEEPLGSVTLGPSEYLDTNLDPRELVGPGNSFEAKFVVSELPENATTYRLRACYSTPEGQLRCKEDDFK